MRSFRWMPIAVVLPLLIAGFAATQTKTPQYVKKETRAETILASLRASGLPSLEGPWHWIGPFDNPDEQAFERSYPPEKEIDLQKVYEGRDGEKAGWRPFKKFKLGEINDLKLFRGTDHCFVYLYHEIDAADAVKLPVSL